MYTLCDSVVRKDEHDKNKTFDICIEQDTSSSLSSVQTELYVQKRPQDKWDNSFDTASLNNNDDDDES